MGEKEETYLAKLVKGWRITVYGPVREYMDLKEGDRLRVTIMKVDETDKETFLANIIMGSRITVFEPNRESLGLEVGNLLRVTIKKETEG